MKISKNPKISLVIPGYNEEANIEETVQKCLATLNTITEQYEVIIVDDGSRDEMGKIADRLQTEYSSVRVIHNPINMGMKG